MKSLKKDTLAYQLGVRPGVQKVNRQDVFLPSVVSQCNNFKTGNTIDSSWTDHPMFKGSSTKSKPEEDALLFYMMNHAVSVVAQKVNPLAPLGKYLPVVEAYHSTLSILSVRMFYYLLLICTRESRHVKNESTSSLAENVTKNYGLPCKEFLYYIRGSGSDGAVSKLMSHAPKVTLGTYTQMLSYVFHNGHFSGGYGGHAWGKVADVLRDFVHGTISAEAMMDTAFTLCHNNGPIFNKGMLFHSYDTDIYTILDVQRSGQMPQMVANKETSHITTRVQSLFSSCVEVLPEEFSGYVDWYKVEALGALKKYPAQKEAQDKKYGKGTGLATPKKPNQVKVVDEYGDTDPGPTLEVMPGVFVPIVDRPIPF